MPSRIRLFAAFVTVMTAVTGLGLGRVPARAATAEAEVELGPTRLADGFRSMVVDDAHLQVFVSSYWSDTVTVLDFTGRIVKTLTGLDGANALLLDGTTLYVVLEEHGTVDAYDTRTLRRVARYGDGTLVHPRPLAMAGGKLWTSTGECDKWHAQLASIDLTTKAVQVHEVPTGLRWCIGLAHAPNDSDRLLAFTPGLQPPSSYLFDVSGDSAELLVEQRQETMNGQPVVLPGEDRFLAPAHDPYGIGQFRMSDLSRDDLTYTAGFGPRALAVTEARRGLLAIGLWGSYGDDIEVVPLTEPGRPIFAHDFSSPGLPEPTVFSDGLAWSGDGRWLFAVSGDGTTGETLFHAFLISVTDEVDDPKPVPDPVPGPVGPIEPPVVPPPGLPNVPSTIAGTGPKGASGYWLLSRSGAVYAFGSARHYGNDVQSAIDIEATPSNLGYWILGRNGQVAAKGDAARLGDVRLPAGEQAVSLSATPTGRGYWVFTDKGRAFPFGDAPFCGDLAAVTLRAPVLGSVATPSGNGYWMVASDGGVFTFGDARFSGSTGDRRLNRPVMAMAADPDGSGYWLIASDGGVFAFDAAFHGSTGALRLNRPITGIVPGPAGYLMVAEDGGTFAFGAVPFHGSLGANPPAEPIVAVALAR